MAVHQPNATFSVDDLLTATRLIGLGALCMALIACSGRETPAPVESLYQGKNFQDFERNAFRGNTYTVQPGDTLFSIAWFSGNDYRDLARLNDIGKPYSIYPGQKLLLESTSKSATSTSTNTSGQTSKTNANSTVDRPQKQAYGDGNKIVKKGDSRSETVEFPNRISRWVWPASGKATVASTATGNANKGIEIRGKTGDPIRAAADGKVVYTGSALRGYGQLVIIKHSETFLSAYAHNDTIVVNEQQWVKAGQTIASMGKSGTDKVKLRFEVRYKGKSVDPMRYLPKQNNNK